MRARTVRARLALVLLAATLGCSTAYYAAMEQVGREKRHILADRVEAGRDDQQEAQEQFLTTYERFKEASGFDGGDLEDFYTSLNRDFERSEARAEDVRARIRSIEDVAGDLFAEWEAEIDQISSADLRRRSAANLRETQGRYETLIAAMQRASASMDPVLTAFRDQVLFLKHNLNAAAIASLEGNAREIRGDVDALIRNMEKSIAEADAFIATLEG
jgi:gas vesicle protein